MIKHKYGSYDDSQFADYLKQLHKKIFWLLVYKDPTNVDKYAHVDFDQYFSNLMKELDGLNELLGYPTEMIRLMSLLESAHIETTKQPFCFTEFRRLILDAHGVVDKIGR